MSDFLFKAYVAWIMFGPMICLYGVVRLWSRLRVERAANRALEKRVEALEKAWEAETRQRPDWAWKDGFEA